MYDNIFVLYQPFKLGLRSQGSLTDRPATPLTDIDTSRREA